MPSFDQLFKTLRTFAATMAREDYEINDVLTMLGDSVTDVLRVTGAGISVIDDDVLRFVTSSNERVTVVEMVQEEHQEGPCVSAWSEQRMIVVGNLEDEHRWPAVRSAAERVDLKSVIGLPLGLGSNRLGTLNIYDYRQREWSGDQLDAAQVLADIATSYIVHASKLDELRRLSGQLQGALDSRVVIEQAKGRISSEHDVTVDRAFALIRDHARSTQRPLKDVAADIVEGRLVLSDG